MALKGIHRTLALGSRLVRKKEIWAIRKIQAHIMIREKEVFAGFGGGGGKQRGNIPGGVLR